MHWKFDPYFEIKILHGKYPPPGLGQPDPPAPVFTIAPTPATERLLRSMGWICKSSPAGGACMVFAEKIVAPDGTASLRKRPDPAQGFSFVILLTDPNLLQATQPYMRPPTQAEMDAEPNPQKKSSPKPNTPLPAFSGRSRLLYFDNLNALAAGKPNAFFISASNAVSFADFGSRFPQRFSFSPGTAGVSKIEMLPRMPGGSVQAFDVNNATNSTEIALAENGYKLTPKPAGASETVFLSDETLPANTLGVVRIFQPPGADWEPARHYQIFFDKA